MRRTNEIDTAPEDILQYHISIFAWDPIQNAVFQASRINFCVHFSSVLVRDACPTPITRLGFVNTIKVVTIIIIIVVVAAE
jgi:hypothetical protein